MRYEFSDRPYECSTAAELWKRYRIQTIGLYCSAGRVQGALGDVSLYLSGKRHLPSLQLHFVYGKFPSLNFFSR